jgi:hypothetical protein
MFLQKKPWIGYSMSEVAYYYLRLSFFVCFIFVRCDNSQ